MVWYESNKIKEVDSIERTAPDAFSHNPQSEVLRPLFDIAWTFYGDPRGMLWSAFQNMTLGVGRTKWKNNNNNKNKNKKTTTITTYRFILRVTTGSFSARGSESTRRSSSSLQWSNLIIYSSQTTVAALFSLLLKLFSSCHFAVSQTTAVNIKVCLPQSLIFQDNVGINVTHKLLSFDLFTVLHLPIYPATKLP